MLEEKWEHLAVRFYLCSFRFEDTCEVFFQISNVMLHVSSLFCGNTHVTARGLLELKSMTCYHTGFRKMTENYSLEKCLHQ